MSDRSTRPDLESVAARELAALLRLVPVGAPLPTAPYVDLFVTLEYLMGAILSLDHSEWAFESIDGLSSARAMRTGEASVELLGTCILITDQTVTPFALDLRLGAEQTIDALRLRLGEPGAGQLGISGPPYGSTAADTLRMGLPMRVDQVDWAYDISW